MESKVTIYTDGACSTEAGIGGYGSIIVHNQTGTEKVLSEGYRNTTNNRMELMAVIKGLEALTKQCDVLIVSDSKYVVDAVEKGWLEKWLKKKNFDNKKNEDLWRRFWKIYLQHRVSFQWVRGHNEHPMNERCDKLAVNAKTYPNLIKDTRV